MAIACLGGAFSGLDTAVNIAFPAITAAFRLDPVQIQWVIVAYVLSYATLLLPLGRLADRVGHGRVLVLGLGLSAVALTACALAPVFVVFLVARMVQGLGVGLVLASAPALVSLAATEEGRARALGLFQMAVALGVAVGPPIGGLLVQVANWRGVFWFRAPLALAACALALATGLWRSRPVVDRPPPLDLGGAVAFGLALAGVLVAARWSATWGWLSPTTLSVLGAGLAALAVFVAIERRTPLPLVDLGLLRVPSFALANGLNLVANATMFVLWLLGPYLLVTVRGHGTVPGGLLFSAMSGASALAAAGAGRLVARVGTARLSALGLAIQAVGLAAMSRVGPSTPTVMVVAALALVGLGLGLFSVPNLSFVMGSIPRSQQGVASGMSQMVRTVGIVTGVAVANSFFEFLRGRESTRLGVDDLQAAAVFVPAFAGVALAAAAICALAALAAATRRATV